MAKRSRPVAPVQTLLARSDRLGGVTLLIATADGEVWRNRCEDGAWRGWALHDQSGEDLVAPAAMAMKGSPFRVDGRWALHYEDPGTSRSLELGGYISGGAAHVAAAAHEDGSLDVFAIWADTAILRRRFDREWSEWQLVDLLAAPAGAYRLLRPRDLVSLGVRSSGLVERTSSSGTPEWLAESAGGQLIVDFPPQHIAETVLTSTTSSAARLAGPSTLRFAVRNEPIALSAAGVLRAITALQIDRASALELPWRLLLAIEANARCAHRQLPASSSAGVAEIWHTRLLGEKGTYAAIRPFASLRPEMPFASGTPLKETVIDIANAGAAQPEKLVPTDRLILSACGAWLSASAVWPDLQWTHKTAMARDYYVRVVKQGVLFPFGHRAALVSTYERRFDTAAPAVAGLRESLALVITEPVCEYGVSAPHERAFPFQRIEVAPRLVERVDLPPQGENAFWPTRAGEPLVFAIRGTSGGEVIEMELPLLFSDGATPAQLEGIFARGPRGSGAAARPAAQVGRFMPLAMRSAHEAVPGAVHQVRSLRFGGMPISGGPGFHPRIAELEVELPAVNQLLGAVGPLTATLSDELLASTPASPPKVLLKIEALKLNFGSARTGVVAAPNILVDRISTDGPTMARLPTNPATMFGPDARLLGVVPLARLISRITESSQPRITWTGGARPTATMTWKQTLTSSVPPFNPRPGCQVDLTVTSSVAAGQQPKVVTHGVISNFTLNIPPGERPLVTLGFNHVTFHVETGGLPVTSFDIASATLGGNLAFIQKLGQYIPNVGKSGPKIEVSATEIKAAYVIAIPTPIALGAFTLQNLQLRAGIVLSLVNAPVTIDFAFGSRAKPFLVTVTGFGGGGYLELSVGAGDPDAGLQRFVGGIEFGASVAMNFGVAEGEVHVFGGVVFTKVRRDIEITGYLRIGGMVRVLGLISVSVELTVSLTYALDRNELTGEAKLVIAVDLTFWSTAVEISCRKTFKGSDLLLADSGFALGPAPGASVADALGPIGDSFPWQTYCHAFAEE